MKKKSPNTLKLGQISLCLLVSLAGSRRVLAGDVDLSKLPPPATNHIDFARDIRPILENSCLRCHGPQKPRNQFRLDNRPAALKGGDDGMDIVPGNSAKSPLILYVARLVEDSEMPPADKGTPLTTNEIALLRAWIDQGVVWDAASTNGTVAFAISPVFGGSSVSGDNHKFREQYGQREGLFGGVDQFSFLQQSNPDTRLTVDGHVLRDDYKIELSKDRNNLGFIHSGWEQYRKYYDDLGGYDPLLLPNTPSLGEDLHLDIGRAWIDFGLTLPNWPKMVLGYEYDYRQGNEASTEWSTVGLSHNSARNIGPASTSINEHVNILKFDLDEDIKGISIEERFRGEFYHLGTGGTNVAFGPLPQSQSEGTSYFQGANTIRVEKKINDWSFASAGYLYSKLNANSSVDLDQPTLSRQTSLPRITLERESHVGNLNGLLGPFDGLTISSGLQAEWTRQNGFGAGTYDDESQLPAFLVPFNVSSDYDQASLRENLGLNYTKIPFTSLFAEGRFEQQNIGQNDQFAASDDILNNAVFSQHTAFSSQSDDLRCGFSTSPWRWFAFSADYRHYEDDSRYDSDPLVQPVPTAYPTFIRSRELITDEVGAKLVLHANSRLKTTFSYRYQADSYGLDTQPFLSFGNVISPGGQLTAGEDHSHTFSINETWKPMPRLFLSGTFSYEISSLTTASQGSPTVVPYKGDIYSFLGSGTYVLTENSDLFAGYSYSEANYGQNNFVSGLPLGIDYQRHSAQAGITRRFGPHVSAKLEYRFDYYSEPSSGGAANYRAHSVFGVLAFSFW